MPATALLLLSPLSLISCGSADRAVEVRVSNPTGEPLGPRTVEIDGHDAFSRLRSKGFFITDADGTEIPSQLTYDSLIVFNAEVEPGGEKVYTLHPSDSIRQYPATVWGQVYGKRRDDVSYENEFVGFRIYGPGTQQAGEKAFGYDIFFKHPTEELIVPLLYAPETDDAVWAKVDSLRSVSPELADEFIRTFSYHIDHGLGMDCYAVGPTLGAGVAALAGGDSIYYPWCYENAGILDNGPLRFTLMLDFAPRQINGDNVTEHRLITLDSGSHLNKTLVWYDGLTSPVDIVAGFPLRDDSAPLENLESGYIAYSDPTQGPDNGKALLGLTFDGERAETVRRDGHILMSRPFAPDDTLSYSWGFAWDRADIPTQDSWEQYLRRSRLGYTVTVE